MTGPSPPGDRDPTAVGAVSLAVAFVALAGVVALLAGPSLAGHPGGAAVDGTNADAVADARPPVEADEGRPAVGGVRSGPTLDPVARCSLSATEIEPGESVTLDASASEDAIGYRFDKFGDGEFGDATDSPTRTFTYDEEGVYEPRVEVEGNGGVDGAICGTLTVERGFSADFEYVPDSPGPGEGVEFEALLEGDANEPVTYRWDWTGDGEFEAVTDDPVAVHAFPEPGEYTVTLEVVDEDGTTATASKTVTVEEPLSADFEYVPDSPAPEEGVEFEALLEGDASGPVTYRWDWTGDGEFETTTQDPVVTHAFPEPGEYTVTLEVVDEDGTTATASKTVTVGEPLSAEISYTPDSPAPGEEVTFEGVLSGDYSGAPTYRWDWTDDGEFEAVTEDPVAVHAFPEPGDYIVTLEIVDEDGTTATASKTVTVEGENEPPTAEFVLDPSAPVAGSPVQFVSQASDEDGDVVEYLWRVDGEPVSDEASYMYTFEEAGEHSVTLTVTDDDGATDSVTREVTVEADGTTTTTATTTTTTTTATTATTTTTPVGEVTAGWWFSPFDAHAGESVTLTADGPDVAAVTYRWDVDDDGEFEKRGHTVLHAFPEPGEYTVTLRAVGPDDQESTQSGTVPVAEAPDESGEGGTGSDRSFRVDAIDPRAGEAVTLVAGGPTGEGATYRWDVDDDGEFEKRGHTVLHAFPEPGEYTVTLERGGRDGETARDSRSVSVDERPADDGGRQRGRGPSFWVDPIDPRPGELTSLVADPAASPEAVAAYRWDLDGDGEFEAQGRSVVYVFDGGEFSVNLVVERTNGSTAEVGDTVAVADEPADDGTPGTTAADNGTPGTTTADDGTPGTTATDDGTATDEAPLPGFGPLVALLALVSVAVLARRWGDDE